MFALIQLTWSLLSLRWKGHGSHLLQACSISPAGSRLRERQGKQGLAHGPGGRKLIKKEDYCFSYCYIPQRNLSLRAAARIRWPEIRRGDALADGEGEDQVSVSDLPPEPEWPAHYATK